MLLQCMLSLVEKSHDIQMYSHIVPAKENPMSLLKVCMNF
jgi:hypothetical protein